MAQLDEHADLGHYLVTVTHITSFDVNTISTSFVSLCLILLPDIKINATSGVVVLPLGTTSHGFIALRHVSYVKISIILIFLSDGCPLHAHAHDWWGSIRDVVRIEFNIGEWHVLSTVPFVKLRQLFRIIFIAQSFHIILHGILKAIVARFWATHELHFLHKVTVLVHIGHYLEAKLYLTEGRTINDLLSLPFVSYTMGSITAIFRDDFIQLLGKHGYFIISFQE